MPEAKQPVEQIHEDDVDAIDLFNEIADTDDFPDGDSVDVDESLGHADEEQPEDDAQDEPDESSQASDDQTDADATEKQDASEKDAQSETPNPDEDLWAESTEAQRRAFQELQHERQKLTNDVRANAGRVQGYAKKLNEVEAELAALKAQQQKAPTPSGEGNSGDDFDLNGKSLQEIEEDYPEVAQYVRHQVQQVVSQFDKKLNPVLDTTRNLQGSYEQITANEQQHAVRQELDRLQQVHPDYVDVRRSPAFNQWLETRTNGVSPTIKQQLVRSMSASDNIDLLDMYKASRQPATPTKKVDAGKLERLAEHAEIPRRGAAPPQGLPEDPIELFNLIADD